MLTVSHLVTELGLKPGPHATFLSESEESHVFFWETKRNTPREIRVSSDLLWHFFWKDLDATGTLQNYCLEAVSAFVSNAAQ